MSDKSDQAIEDIFGLKTSPDLLAKLKEAAGRDMTPEEMESQRQSWARAMEPCEHGVRDWETCRACLADAEAQR